MANTFLAAQGKKIGKSLCEQDLVATAREIIGKAKDAGREIVLPGRRRGGAKNSRRMRPRASVDVDDVGATT